MTKTKKLLLAALLAIMLVSCDLFSDFNRTDDLDTLEANSFYAQNMETGKYYKVKAEMIYEGDKCVIWAEKGSGITRQMAIEIAFEYDTIIRPRVAETFSIKDFYINDKEYYFNDMLDYANWLADRNDKKLTILLLDIQDGFKDPKNDSYVAGYFSGGNFNRKGKIFGTVHYSNGRDMIYVDTYPGLEMKPEQTYATFAHELQHLINFVTSFLMNRKYMDTWVDEGLSSQAEYLYFDGNPHEKCVWFSSDMEGTIANGNNFFVWDNHKDKPLAILDDYATVYLFFRWLYLQADTELKSHIFRDIETSNYPDYQAVTNIKPEWSSWETLLRTWLAANYYPENANYGYKDDLYLIKGEGSEDKNYKGIKVKSIEGQRISLYPGEGVYSNIKNSFSASTSGNIRYAGLAKNETTIGTSSPYTGDVLLTFNANTNNAKSYETGSLTGVSPAVSRTAAGNTPTGKFIGPYVIDARDMLERSNR